MVHLMVGLMKYHCIKIISVFVSFSLSFIFHSINLDRTVFLQLGLLI